MYRRPSPRRALWRVTVLHGVYAGMLALALGSQAAAAAPFCPNTPQLPAMSLPRLRAALAAGMEAVIVALGSSSTQGVGASDQAHGYPAVLQAALAAALPTQHVTVLNRGIGGQDAPEELARLDADVIAVRPQLAIWQVGANAAMGHADPVAFRQLVTSGVRRMQEAGIDVILMDNQRAPQVVASANHVAMEAGLAQVARETGASLFARSELMDAWNRAGAPPAEFIGADRLHHNDRGYYCVARTLADGIVGSLHTQQPQTASR
jgi:acyl-CoA thioesterase-1